MKNPILESTLNSQAIMFISNVLANSNNMGAKNREKGWAAKDLDNYIVYETLPDGTLRKDSNDNPSYPTNI